MAHTATSYRLPSELTARMAKFKAETGMSQAQQVIKGVSAWLTEQESFRAQLKKSLALAKKGTK